jgi:PadR family transcriptional regulator PadR
MTDQDTLHILLDQWETTYKRGLLSFWLLLLLHERPMYVFEMGEALEEVGQGTVSADEKSLYRALRRFEAVGLVTSSWEPSEIGPRRRYYHLTLLGNDLLRRFVERNIMLFHEPAVSGRLAAVVHEAG